MVTPKQRDHLRRQVLAIRDKRPIFVLDFWNDGPYVDGCIAGGRKYFHVNAKGDVEPCVYTHIAIDNITETPLAQALNSNPHVMRDVIHKTGARFTHPGAEEIYTAQKDRMDAYAENWGQLADRVWEKEYEDGRLKEQIVKGPAYRAAMDSASSTLSA